MQNKRKLRGNVPMSDESDVPSQPYAPAVPKRQWLITGTIGLTVLATFVWIGFLFWLFFR